MIKNRFSKVSIVFIISVFLFSFTFNVKDAQAVAEAVWQCNNGVPRVIITWDEHPGATYYSINSQGFIGTVFAPQTNYTDDDLFYNHYYRYVIFPDNENAEQVADVTTGSCIAVTSFTGPTEVTYDTPADYSATFTLGYKPGSVNIQMKIDGVWVAGGSNPVSATVGSNLLTVGPHEVCVSGVISESPPTAPGSVTIASQCMSVTVPVPVSQYTVEGIVKPENTAGTIETTPQTITSGNTASFEIVPSEDYLISSVTGTAGTGCASISLISGNTYTTGPITSSCEVTATFVYTSPSYVVTGTVLGANGTISPLSQPVESSSTASFEIVPSEDYLTSSVTGTTGTGCAEISLISGDTWTTGPIYSPCTVAASFSLEPAPDLVVDSTIPTSAVIGISTTLSSTISNAGSLSTGASFYNFFQIATEEDGGGDIADLASTLMSSLDPSVSDTTEQSYPFPSEGIYSIRACADKSSSIDTGTIDESNEDNNCGTWTSVNVAETYTIDLIAGNAVPISPVVDISTTLSSTISNAGSLSTGDSFYNFFQVATEEDGGGDIADLASTLMSSLDPSVSDTTEQSYPFPSEGIYSIRACADRSSSVDTGTIDESDEDNNCGTWVNISVSPVPLPNLVASNALPDLVTAGVETTLSSTISNAGSLSTGASFYNFFQVATEEGGGGDIADLASTLMSSLNANSNDNTYQSYAFPSDGIYSIRACSDKDSSIDIGIITELNENDNCGNWITVTASGTAVDGIWTDWSAWSDCSVSICGQIGTQSRTRTCTNPAPQYGGDDCVGSPIESQSCSAPLCDSTVLSANPSVIVTGDSSVLSWFSDGSSCEGTNFETGGAISGSVSVTPNSTTIYTITCDDVPDEATVTVRKRPRFWEN